MKNAEVERRLKRAVKFENRIQIDILTYLEMVETRKIFADRYDSIQTYCRKELKYSDSEGQRRIDAMRVMRRNPILKTYLRDESLSVSQVVTLGRLELQCKREKKKFTMSEMIHLVRNKSVRDTDSIVRDACGLEVKYNITFKVGEKTHMNWLAYRHAFHTKSDQELFESMFGAELRLQKITTKPRKLSQESRCASPVLKHYMLQRADYRCEEPKCSNRFNLQIDHIIPYSQGGKTEVSNLRVLCQMHNLMRI